MPNATSPARLAAEERQRQALMLRRAGATYDSIARQLGYANASGARKAVMTLLRRVQYEEVGEARRLELERLDAMLLAVWRQVQAGHLGASDRALRIAERRARLLGLDAPTKIAPTDAEGKTLDLASLVALARSGKEP